MFRGDRRFNPPTPPPLSINPHSLDRLSREPDLLAADAARLERAATESALAHRAAFPAAAAALSAASVSVRASEPRRALRSALARVRALAFASFSWLAISSSCSCCAR